MSPPSETNTELPKWHPSQDLLSHLMAEGLHRTSIIMEEKTLNPDMNLPAMFLLAPLSMYSGSALFSLLESHQILLLTEGLQLNNKNWTNYFMSIGRSWLDRMVEWFIHKSLPLVELGSCSTNYIIFSEPATNIKCYFFHWPELLDPWTGKLLLIIK